MLFISRAGLRPGLWLFTTLLGIVLYCAQQANGQQIQWAKLYPLPKQDDIRCIARDSEGNMYAGGRTQRNFENPTPDFFQRGFLMKLNQNGDTLYTRYFEPGTIYSIAVDHFGNIRVNILEEAQQSIHNNLLVLQQMTPDGFVFKRDTIPFPLGMFPYANMIGKDSSLIIVGTKPRQGNPSQQSMFFLRMQKDGLIDPWVELNPGHPLCVANRIEQLPNGHYLVSGYVGSRIASYELDEWGLFPVFKQWYQTPDFSNLSSGYVGQLGKKNWMIGAQGNPSIIGALDSLGNKRWFKKESGQIVPPQAIVDQSIVFGYRTGIPPYQVFYRMGIDSNYVWNIAFRDSLVARGFIGNMDLTCFAFFEDESAVVAGNYNGGTGTTTGQDPIFLRIANVGTPVTSLSKPRKGSLANETLAPWPNPTGGTLYLKQHFDKAEVRLYNLAGKEVGQYQIRFGQPIDVSAFPAGVYLYRANIDGRAFSGKIIRN